MPMNKATLSAPRAHVILSTPRPHVILSAAKDLLLLPIALLALTAACEKGAPAAARDTMKNGTLPDTNPCYNIIFNKWNPAKVTAEKFVVNTATRGMTAQMLWALSPDSASMIVVEDPKGVENAEIPDGALFVNERTGRAFRLDSIWSVAPSPDWSKLMFGKASVVSADGGDSIPEARWAQAAKSLESVAGPQPGLVAESLKAKAHSINGMTAVKGVSAAFLADVSLDTVKLPVEYMGVGGWSVAWSCDDAPFRKVGRTPPAAQVPWQKGPVLEINRPLKASPNRYFDVRNRRVAGMDNKIYVINAGKDTTAHYVGPGLLMGATRNGKFVLAIAPRVPAKANESPEQVVVYRVP
jgi:hypothetical protein